MRTALLAVLLTLVAIVLACTKTEVKPERICTPGNYVFCRCKDRSEGTKLCDEDGLGFAPCEGCLSGSDDNDEDDIEPEPEPKPKPGKDSGPPPPEDAGPVTGTKPSPGEILISEIMHDPSGPEPTEEWFEVTNNTSSARVLNGLTIRDAAGRTAIIPATPTISIEPNAYVVLARNKPAAIAAGVQESAIVFEYGEGVPDTLGVLLANGATGGISLLDGTTVISSVTYGPWFTQAPPGGASLQLKSPSSAQSKDGWCLSTLAWAGRDKGTPGSPSVCQ